MLTPMKTPDTQRLENGRRMTKARAAISALLSGARSPLSVAELLESLAKQRIRADKTTVYREIAFLEAQHVVRQIQFKDRVKRYELAHGHHHHLVCVECGAVTDVALGGDVDALEKRITKKTGFAIQDHSLEFFGVCKECQS